MLAQWYRRVNVHLGQQSRGRIASAREEGEPKLDWQHKQACCGCIVERVETAAAAKEAREAREPVQSRLAAQIKHVIVMCSAICSPSSSEAGGAHGAISGVRIGARAAVQSRRVVCILHNSAAIEHSRRWRIRVHRDTNHHIAATATHCSRNDQMFSTVSCANTRASD